MFADPHVEIWVIFKNAVGIATSTPKSFDRRNSESKFLKMKSKWSLNKGIINYKFNINLYYNL